jgi:large subunit ribosomal protein L43
MPRITPRTLPVSGYQHFLTPLRRLIFDYDPLSPSQHGVRAYLRRPLLAMAQANPDVEVLVRKLRRGKAAVLRGHYGKLDLLFAKWATLTYSERQR